MRIALLMTVAFLSIAMLDRSTLAGERLNRAGRWMGFGWSEGYHACQFAERGPFNNFPPDRFTSRLHGMHRRDASELIAPSSCSLPACPAAAGSFTQGAVGTADSSSHHETNTDGYLPLRDLPLAEPIISGAVEADDMPEVDVPTVDDGPAAIQRPAADAEDSAALGSVQRYGAVVGERVVMPTSAAQPTRLPPPPRPSPANH